MSDKRRKQRQLFDCALEITWKDGQAVSHTMAVEAIDLSDSGIRVESNERIELHTEVFVRAERYGLTERPRYGTAAGAGRNMCWGWNFIRTPGASTQLGRRFLSTITSCCKSVPTPSPRRFIAFSVLWRRV